ncbi:MAG: GIY-YIG nuclease family protein [Patescibacteria group bacterium]
MRRERQYCVYIMTNKFNRVLYTGVTNNLQRRVHEHRDKVNKCFTAKYNANKLVYYEVIDDIRIAIAREKQIKGWLRKKKVMLIKGLNPTWRDLSKDLFPESY